MFLVSRSYLFHAYAWLKLYEINEKHNKGMTESARGQMASALVLAALAVPVVPKSISISSYPNDEADKHKRMATLLGYQFSPDRSQLIKQVKGLGLVDQCDGDVQELFDILENQYCPLTIVSSVSPLLSRIRSIANFEAYASGIEELLLIRLVQQLGKVSFENSS